MPETATTEPTSVTAGDTISWAKTLTGYPATDYVLKYALQQPGEDSITIIADADGTIHDVGVSAAASALWPAGEYSWTSYVEDLDTGEERYTIERGTMLVLPSAIANLASTHATRTLALINAAIEGRVPNGLETSTIDGQTLERIPIQDLFALRQKYQQIVNNERLAARSASGKPARRTIGIRFVKP